MVCTRSGGRRHERIMVSENCSMIRAKAAPINVGCLAQCKSCMRTGIRLVMRIGLEGTSECISTYLIRMERWNFTHKLLGVT